MLMQSMRGIAGKIIIIITTLVFAGWLVFEGWNQIRGNNLGANEIGSVNGDPITAQAFQATYQNLYDQAQQARQGTGESLSRDQVRQLEESAWNQLVTQTLMQQELKRRGIGASDAEIREAALWNPPPALMQQEIFQTDGQFDIRKYQQFISGPTANEELLLQLEQYYRSAVPEGKLLRQITAGAYLSDAELWRAWQDRNETVTTEYVALDPARLVPGEVQVSDDEVAGYYKTHSEEFTRPATARVTLAYLSKAAAPADTAAALARADSLRRELVAGANFADVAQRESADPASRANGGELGTFGRGQMVPAFDQAAFSLPVGAISQPILTPFGYHLVQVEEREGDQVRARHILIPFDKSEAETDRLFARADSLESLAEKSGVERAARVVGATVRPGVTISGNGAFLPGVGSATDALEWVRDEWAAQGEAERPRSSELFETPQAFYLIRPEAYSPAGTIALAEATPEIRRQLVLEKKREKAAEIGRALAAQVRRGAPLATVAAGRGLAVASTGPFTRLDPNPVFGQANAAIGAAFGVPVGQVSDPVETPSGVFLIRPVNRTQADRAAWETQKAAQRAALTAQLQQSVLEEWLQNVREQAKIVDRRAEVLRPST